MRCPVCGVYHPPLYEECVSCGAKLGNDSVQKAPGPQREEPATEQHARVRKSAVSKQKSQSAMPAAAGIAIALLILLVSAGATVFFLIKSPDYERLYQTAQHQLANGQYAFAVKTLEQAAASRPRDARIYLALARAYVGIDQIDKSWNCISQAQQMGQSLASEPALASELSNFYRQHQQWDRAAELLKPLAQAGIVGKKAELADLDALWGDECLQKGDLNQALKCWEEVRSTAEGSRTTEVDSRLSTIYQRFINESIAKGDDTRALDYLTKLNVIAPSARAYEKVADIYERQGQLELAIDQLRRAAKLQVKDPLLDGKLATLMVKRGKQLLEAGDAQTGLGYLQEARNYDPKLTVPPVVLKNVTVAVVQATHRTSLSGEVYNPGSQPILSLVARVELVDTATSHVIWEKEQRIIDEFEPPLQANGSKQFSVTAPVAVKENGSTEFRTYISGTLYKSYPIGTATPSTKKVPETRKNSAAAATPQPAPAAVPQIQKAPSPAPPAGTTTTPGTPQPPEAGRSSAPASAEDKTMKDLEP